MEREQEESSLEHVMKKSGKIIPQQQNNQPGQEFEVNPVPDYMPFYPGVGKFKDKVVLISGGDSGIGRAVALAFANEGALISIIYRAKDQDAALTKQLVENFGSPCLLLPGNIGDKNFCSIAIQKTIEAFGIIDILINNALEEHVETDFQYISEEQLINTFRTNIFANFFLIQAALPYIPEQTGNIINSASVNTYKENSKLIDYTATKGAMIALTRALAQNLLKKGIRVNAVAPGPIWAPLIPTLLEAKEVGDVEKQAPMGRAGQPNEVAGAFTWLASLEASYVTGQVIHPNGGYILNT